MSSKATTWAWEQDLPVGEKLALLAIADGQGPAGALMFGAQRDLAAMTGMGERTVRRHLAALEEKGLIRRRAQYEFGNRIADHIELAVPLPANLAGDVLPANGHVIPARLATGQIGRAHSSSSGSIPRNGSLKDEGPGQIGRCWPGVPDEMRRDAEALLRSKKKVGGRIVSEVEMEIAAAALAEFNRQADSDYGLGANLIPIVMRVRDRSSADAATHVRLVQSAWRIRWWERSGNGRRPAPQVIYGERAFENVWQDAVDEAAGRKVEVAKPTGRRVFSPDGRTWDQLSSGEKLAAQEAISMGLDPAQERSQDGQEELVVTGRFTAANFLDAE